MDCVLLLDIAANHAQMMRNLFEFGAKSIAELKERNAGANRA